MTNDIEFSLRLLEQSAARDLRKQNIFFHGRTIEFVLNQIVQRLIAQPAVGAVTR